MSDTPFVLKPNSTEESDTDFVLIVASCLHSMKIEFFEPKIHDLGDGFRSKALSQKRSEKLFLNPRGNWHCLRLRMSVFLSSGAEIS